MTRESNPDAFFLPKIFRPTNETDVIEKPPLSSIILMCNGTDVSNFNVRFVYGMKVMCATFVDVYLSVSLQSVMHIIFDNFFQISIELQRIISNRRGNQFTYASSTIQISYLTWCYLREKFGLDVHYRDKVCTNSTICWNDLATLQVKL
jgi:hypothetical protein